MEGAVSHEGRKNIRAMAHKNDYQIQKQLDKPQTWFCKYYPSRIRNVGEKEITDRQLVFDFKDGRAYEEVAQRTDRKSTRLNSSHMPKSRMPSSA